MSGSKDVVSERVLYLAPIAVTPTKPLTPTHLKGLLSVDLLERATRRVRPVVYEVNRTPCDLSCQTLDFWSWLEAEPRAAVADLDDVGIGQLYVGYHRSTAAKPPATAELIARVERGYIHPVSKRLLDIWKAQYALLGLRDPGLDTARPLETTRTEVYAVLQRNGWLLDQRAFGGPTYLDLTDQGLPLRPLVDPLGRDNYLLSLLRELLARAAGTEDVALLCDKELAADYQLLERVLVGTGRAAFSISMPRISLPGVGQGSARQGGWEDYTVSRLTERFLPKHSVDAFKLGLRLYLLVGQGPGCKEPFRFDLLERFIRRAQRLLDTPARASRDAGLNLLRNLSEGRGFVDPYRVASALLTPNQEGDLLPWIPDLFL